MKKTWKTEVSDVLPGKVIIRGYSLEDIIPKLSFTEGIFLTIIGKLPNENEARVMNAMLNTLLDHGFVASTVVASRYIASGNPQFIPAVAGGLLAAGSNTVSPEHSSEFINKAYEKMKSNGWSIEEAAEHIANELVQSKGRIPGLGHPTHKDSDFRATKLREVAENCGFVGERTRLYEAIHKKFLEKKGKSGLPINIDGMLACVMTEMGFQPKQMVAVAILSVLPGLMAHVIEEINEGVPLRYIPDELEEYVGEPEKSLIFSRSV